MSNDNQGTYPAGGYGPYTVTEKSKDWKNQHNTHSAAKAKVVALSDSAVFGPSTRAFMVDVTGTLKVRFAGNQALITIPVVAGVLYPLSIDMAYATGTSGPTQVYAFW